MKKGWMKNDEGWMMNDEGSWFLAAEGFWFMTDKRTDKRTDICECRVAFATEKESWLEFCDFPAKKKDTRKNYTIQF